MRICDFGSGRTDPATFPTEALAEAAARGIREVGEDFVLYPGSLGHLGLRELMARREADREGVEVSPEHIALTNGSMQAVTLVAEALLERPGAVIVTEELTYSGTIAAYKGIGASLVGIPVDEHGMRVDLLDETLVELRRGGTAASFVYTLTTYQNPTAAVMPLERKLELIEIARRHDIVVVEDNCYGDVHFEGEIPPALFALDDHPRHVYLGSLSKILAPGLRMGYLYARPPMLERILARRFDAGNSVLAAGICAAYLEGGLWQHIERNSEILKAKRDALLAALDEHAADLCTWTRPVGGMFLWIDLPADCDRTRLAELATERGVVYAPGSSFHIDGADIANIRLAFGYPQLEEIRGGVERLVGCIREATADSG